MRRKSPSVNFFEKIKTRKFETDVGISIMRILQKEREKKWDVT